MGIHVNKLLAALVVFSTLVSAGVALSADDDASSNALADDRWVPALSVVSGFTIMKQGASVESSVRPSASGSDIAVSPYVGANLELMSPKVEIIPTRPRFFMQAGILPTFAFTRNLANEGNPTGFKVPNLTEFPAVAIDGQGSRTSATVGTVVWNANLGVSFDTTIMDRPFRFKPAVGWINFKVDATGIVLNATKTDNADPDPRFVTLQDSASSTYNGIGPGLEVEMGLERFGQFGSSLFMDGYTYRMFGDRTITMQDTFTDAQGTETANWRVNMESWMFRLEVGVRVRWLGK